MTHAVSIDTPVTDPSVSSEVMSRLTAQVLQMGQHPFEQILDQPEDDDFNYDDIEIDDDGDEA
ncbi:MAG TPA: hypothetical protein VFZ93_04885 [Albitalea sp.]